MNRLRDLLGPHVEEEAYLTTADAARHVGCRTRAAFVAWARARCRRIPLRRPPGGRVFLVKKADLDAALARENAAEVRVTAPVAGAVQSGYFPKRSRRGAPSFNAVDLMLAQQRLQQSRDATPAPVSPLQETLPSDKGRPAGAVVKGGASGSPPSTPGSPRSTR